jgi:hypothetical protein
MSVINTGKTFANGEQLTADKLNQVIEQAEFNVDEAVDGSTITLISGAMAVNDNGITETKIENGAVTKNKIENVTDMTVLGNTSGSAAAPQEVDILDEDTMSSDSATSLATQQSIKAYVDSAPNFTPSTYAGEESVTLPNGLIMKFGTGTTVDYNSGQGTSTIDLSVHSSDFPNECLNASATLINPDGGLSANRDGWMQVRSVSTSELKFVTQGTSSLTTPSTYFWQAIGY